MLHDQIRLDPQQQRLAGVGTTGRRLSLQCFRLDQSLFTELKMAVLKAALRTGLKSGQRRCPHPRGHHTNNEQDCDGAREQGTGGRFAEMMPQFRLNSVYTDWTAIALLLFTAVPLLIVVATATYFVIQNDQKTPLG